MSYATYIICKAHGVKFLDLFQFKTSISGYTCDYVDADFGAYQGVRRAFQELSYFDDIVFDGVAQAAGAKTALLYSATSDTWWGPVGTQGTVKRTLYLALKHAGLGVDVVTETDCMQGRLNHYDTLFIVDKHVARAAMHAVGEWVAVGGKVLMSAGAAQRDEYNMTNSATQTLLPVREGGIWTGIAQHGNNATIFYAKQDLPYAEKLDTVTITGDIATDSTADPNTADPSAANGPLSLPVYGEKSIFALATNMSATAASLRPFKYQVTGTFNDGSPAVLNVSHGSGSFVYWGFHPSLAYFFNALPRRPVDRTPAMSGLTNLVPSKGLDGAALQLMTKAAAAVSHARPIGTMPSLVEASLVTRYQTPTPFSGEWNASAILLIDWTATEGNSSSNGYTRVNVSLTGLASPLPFTTATLASCSNAGGCLQMLRPFTPGNPTNTTITGFARFNISKDRLSFSADIAISDAIVLR
jgi:hypothetical protein